MTDVLRTDRDDRGVLTLTIDRPEVKNAFDGELQEALTAAFEEVDDDVRVVVVTGAGTVFSAGADLNWMRSAVDASFEDNVASSRRFEAMLAAVDTCPAPVIARVNGHCLAGALGLVTCADVAVAVRGVAVRVQRDPARPGAGDDLALRRPPHRHRRRSPLPADRRALRRGPSPRARPARRRGGRRGSRSTPTVDALVDAFLAAAPGAVRDTKRLLATIAATPDPADTVDARVELISRRRVSDEGQAGMAAFFDRQPGRPGHLELAEPPEDQFSTSGMAVR